MKNILVLTAIALISIIGLVGCGEDTGWTKVADDDSRLEAAREQARETYPDFLKALKTRKPYDAATVEVFYQGTEYIMVTVIKADEDEIMGVVASYPQKVSLQKGAEVTVPVSDLSDWVIDKDDGETLGGYVQAERARLTKPGN
ncbi:hypothetical protein MNBD_PLANCTO03-1540 [hydrothermal vent metagenome]|uniref:DUF2314 domain-containing protein n=1 Tax=hydrothermal vent metagenome TaxID=652676 RepID=A0A3B1DK98_9ZZZZ